MLEEKINMITSKNKLRACLFIYSYKNIHGFYPRIILHADKTSDVDIIHRGAKG